MARRAWVLLTGVLLAGCQAGGVVPPVAVGTTMVLTARDGVTLAELERAVEARGGTITARLDQIQVLEVVSDDPELATMLAGWTEASASATPVRRRRLGRPLAAGAHDLVFRGPHRRGAEGEPLSGYQWGLDVAQVRAAWAAGYRGRGTRVAVLDTGIDPEQPELAGRLDLAHGASFVAGEPDLLDRHGHGTHVAGLIAANLDGAGVAGVAPEVTILPIKVLDAAGVGDDAAILRGIDHAIAEGADIINLSLEGLWAHDAAGDALAAAYASALRYAAMRGALVIMSAGNGGLTLPDASQQVLPASTGEGLVVGATGPTGGQDFDAPALYTNLGAGFLSLVAPGGGVAFDPETGLPALHLEDLVLAPWSRHAEPRTELGYAIGPADHAWLAGTSQATAFMSGVAALMRSARGPMPPALWTRRLLAACAPLGDPGLGAGRIDVVRAIRQED